MSREQATLAMLPDDNEKQQADLRAMELGLTGGEQPIDLLKAEKLPAGVTVPVQRSAAFAVENTA